MIIKVENLQKSFGDLHVLTDINAEIEENEVISIIGTSGSGKSTFLRCLNLLEQPTGGKIWFHDVDLTAKGVDINLHRQKMGMVFQNFNVFPHMSVEENIMMAPVLLKKKTKEEAHDLAMKLLDRVGLTDKASAFPTSLSGGQKQRLAIVRALAMEPEVMLFDEPTSALDPTMVGEVLATMRGLAKRKMTMLIVTHEMNFAKDIADRVLFFADKGIYEQGTPKQIFENPQGEKTISFIKKLKYFSYHITGREFDLMALQGGIYSFANRYGLGSKTTNRLQLCTEEIIYQILGKNDDGIDIELAIEYSEAEKSILITCTSIGREYNPFDEREEDEDGLGITIIRNMAKSYSHMYENGINTIYMEM